MTPALVSTLLWMRRPHARVPDAKRTTAHALRDLGGIRLPGQSEGDVPAVALTLDHHARDVLSILVKTVIRPRFRKI